jgi:hypothetical protein
VLSRGQVELVSASTVVIASTAIRAAFSRVAKITRAGRGSRPSVFTSFDGCEVPNGNYDAV